MANGSGKGCLANVLIALLVIVCGVGVFFFGANVEKATNGGVTGLVSGDAPAAQPSDQAAEQASRRTAPRARRARCSTTVTT